MPCIQVLQSEKVLEKRFDGPGKVLEFFVIKNVGTLKTTVSYLVTTYKQK